MNKIYNNTYNKSSNFSKYSDLEQCLIVGLPLYPKITIIKTNHKMEGSTRITSIEQFHALKKIMYHLRRYQPEPVFGFGHRY